jgi:hypothetical protein
MFTSRPLSIKKKFYLLLERAGVRRINARKKPYLPQGRRN